MSNPFGIPNHRGPLFNNTTKFSEYFIPPKNDFYWNDTLPSSVQFISYAKAMSTNLIDVENTKIFYLSNNSIFPKQIANFYNRYRPTQLIINQIENDTDAEHDEPCDLDFLIVRRHEPNSNSLELIAKCFPNLKKLFIVGLYSSTITEESLPISFLNLVQLSCIWGVEQTLCKINAPNLESLDIYHIQTSDGKNEKNQKVEIPILTQQTLINLRCDTRLYDEQMMSKHNNYTLLQFYGKNNNVKLSDNFVSGVNKSNCSDLIIPPNGLSVEQINILAPAKLRSLGIYINDKHIDEYLNKYKMNDEIVLLIYGNENLHQAAYIHNKILKSNFNIIKIAADNKSDWWKLYERSDDLFDAICIQSEIVKTRSTENQWPSYVNLNRSRSIFLKHNNLTLSVTYNNIKSIYDLIETVCNASKYKIKCLNLSIIGSHMNEDVIRVALASFRFDEINMDFKTSRMKIL